MPIGNYQWYDITASYIQIKFANNLDTTTLVNSNFNVYTEDDVALFDPFKDIIPVRDFSSISRILTLWWDNPPTELGNYYLAVTDLKNYVSADLADFNIEFTWTLEPSTPGYTDLITVPPSRTPIEVEDYSIKNAEWVIDDTPINDPDAEPNITLYDILPPEETHHYLDPDANEGRIDLLFSHPIAMNYINPNYFGVNRKLVKKGFVNWEWVDAKVVTDPTSMIVSVFLPAYTTESATPIYSEGLEPDEIDGYKFFEPQYKYRLIISKAVGN